MEREKERKRVRRQQRKNRDAFLQLLDELHERGAYLDQSFYSSQLFSRLKVEVLTQNTFAVTKFFSG
jgi:hypothetical protein